MKKKQNLSQKEILFCSFYAICANEREAAARAGYLFPQKSGLKLLGNTAIRQKIESMKKREMYLAEAVDGLRRIAFGTITDSVKIALETCNDTETLEKMDLFSVQEIKIPKTGGMEIKFYDRLKALEKLSEICPQEGDDTSFIEALKKSAVGLTKGRCDQDEI